MDSRTSSGTISGEKVISQSSPYAEPGSFRSRSGEPVDSGQGRVSGLEFFWKFSVQILYLRE
jgi:hypothetical protein